MKSEIKIQTAKPGDVERRAQFFALRAWMVKNYKTATLQVCAKRVKLSPFHFHREFTRLTGEKPKTVIAIAQLAAAQGMMLQGKSLAEVATRCGYAHQSHFCSRFKQITGQTPTAWLRMNVARAEA